MDGPGTAHLNDYPVVIRNSVDWGDMDAFGHVNNTVYFRFFENARIAFFERIGVMAAMKQSGIGPILAHTDCRFRIPLRYPDDLLVGARITEIHEFGFQMHYRVVSGQAGAVAAEGSGRIVMVEYDTGQKTRLPQALAAAIADLGDLGDRSGHG